MNKIYFLLLLFVLLIYPVTALGITPAIKNIEFVPNQEVKITFYALDVSKDSISDVVIGGGSLAEYSSLSSNTIKGEGSSVLTIKFPDKIEKPGEHTVSVWIKERPSEEAFINTVVEVGAMVKTFVPYPGIYGDLTLSIPDANVGDLIPIELYVINRGDNPLDISEVYVDFISNNGTLFSRMDFTPVIIPLNGDRYFRKQLNAKGMEPGNYIGSARVSYSGTINEVNKSFRVGSLFVDITNFTDYLVGGGIKKFYVTLENKWNSPISGVYVDINLSNDFFGMIFRTPSIDLKPWEEKTVESFLDTDGLEGKYNLILNASYHGKSTVIYGALTVGKDYRLMVYGISAIVAIIFFVIIYLVLKHLFGRRHKK